jgi:hypothetical protein
VTACRRSRLLDCRPSARVEIERFQRPGLSQMQAAWLAWVETEKRKRLGLSIYVSSMFFSPIDPPSHYSFFRCTCQVDATRLNCQPRKKISPLPLI